MKEKQEAFDRRHAENRFLCRAFLENLDWKYLSSELISQRKIQAKNSNYSKKKKWFSILRIYIHHLGWVMMQLCKSILIPASFKVRKLFSYNLKNWQD